MWAVQKQINTAGCGVITLKDIHNFKAKMKQRTNTDTQNDLVQLIETMMQIENVSVEVINLIWYRSKMKE